MCVSEELKWGDSGEDREQGRIVDAQAQALRISYYAHINFSYAYLVTVLLGFVIKD